MLQTEDEEKGLDKRIILNMWSYSSGVYTEKCKQEMNMI